MEIANVVVEEVNHIYNITTSPAVVGVDGKSALQVWQQENPGGTYDDWIIALTPKVSFRIEGGDLIVTTL